MSGNPRARAKAAWLNHAVSCPTCGKGLRSDTRLCPLGEKLLRRWKVGSPRPIAGEMAVSHGEDNSRFSGGGEATGAAR